MNKLEKDLICIVCPNGCHLHGSVNEDGILEVTGNRCVRGKHFAGTELTAPARTLTTTVATSFNDIPYLPVRTDGEIPKQAIPEVLTLLRDIRISERVCCGDIVCCDIAGTGINIIATMDL